MGGYLDFIRATVKLLPKIFNQQLAKDNSKDISIFKTSPLFDNMVPIFL